MSEAAEPGDRRTLVVRAVMDARRSGGTVALETDAATVEYADRRFRFAVDADGRAALDDLLADFPVFKVKQPDTRKAVEEVVYVSAIADPKHVADFVEAAFRRVYGLPEDYRLETSRG